MAGENRGKIYELLTALGIRLALKEKGQQVWREKALQGMSIRSDIVVGATLEEPRLVLLVTHSDSEVHHHEKFGRDAAELAELYACAPSVESVGLVIFEDRALPRLEQAARRIFSFVVKVSGLRSAATLRALGASDDWKESTKDLDHEAAVMPTDPGLRSLLTASTRAALLELGEAALQAAASRAGRDHSLRRAVEGLSTPSHRRALPRGCSPFPPQERATRVRRGLAKLLLFTKEERKVLAAGGVPEGASGWAVSLGMLGRQRSIRGERLVVTDCDLVGGPIAPGSPVVAEGVLTTLRLDDIEHCLAAARDKSAAYVQRLREPAYLDAAGDYVRSKYLDLLSVEGMARHLQRVAVDPEGTLRTSGGPRHVQCHWLYTYLVALFKAHSGKKQGFGTTVIAELSGVRRFRMQNSILSTLEYQPTNFDSRLFRPLAKALSLRLKEVSQAELQVLHDKAVAQQLRNELEDKLVCHALNPLPALLVRAAEHAGLEPTFVQARSGLVGATEGTVAGATKIVRFGEDAAWWRTAHDSHVNDKRKELQSKALGWRVHWDARQETFHPTKWPGRLVLVIDGDFRRADLEQLRAAGWDLFLYADELHRLAELA